ncbi:MG2 domain-containing protein [Candidatus Uabimicrobium amorphum]|uniref:UPF0192 protein n=1 Tax=Uabimicrobium amorphum TaxID=2596890 RepID=A0A5S9F6T4_UABAM|nr:MG2 domain-containing protein [Candidatus Uabimicrobium amorphum]BBM87543.1 UPF0192 protein [Candidatus Uabimicrobium amorphum]
MTKKKILFVIAGLMAVVIGVALYSWRVANLVADSQQTVLFAPKKLAPQSKGMLRLWVTDRATNARVDKANVTATLVSGTQTIELGTATSDTNGNAKVAFEIPEIKDGNYKLQVTTESNIGRDVQELDVAIKKDYRILLSTDKPLYQPGQIIHIRSLTMNRFSNQPVANEQVTIEVNDPKGNKVFKKQLPSSEFGIAACDFQLASEINQGTYVVKATCGRFTEEKNLNIKRYVLPKFKIAASFAKDYYMPGETVQGNVDSQYFFGKPVANSTVEVDVATFDVNFNKLLSWKGKTDRDGKCPIEFSLPQKLYGSALTKGSALVTVNIKVTDTANHSQQITKNITVSKNTLDVFAISESSRLVCGVRNTIFLCTTYPNGLPAKTEITINGETIATNDLGIALWQVTPQTIPLKAQVMAVDERGNRIEKQIKVGDSHGTFLGVLDRATYKTGEQVSLDILSTNHRGNFYVDIIKERQAIASYIVSPQNGKHNLKFTLPQDVNGALTVNIYKSSEHYLVERDTRLLFVSPTKDLDITTKLDKDIYRPGENAVIDFTTNSKRAALSISIVDESVFALQEMQPGLEKVYFMLHKELLKPRYQIRYSPPIAAREVVNLPQKKSSLREEKEQATRVMFAMANSAEDYKQFNNSYQPKLEKIKRQKSLYFKKLGTFLLSIPFVIGWLICLLAVVMSLYKFFAQKNIFYQEPSLQQATLARTLFHYKVAIFTVVLLFLSMFILTETYNKIVALTMLISSCAVFTIVASLTTSNSRVRLHRGLLAIFVIVAITALVSTFFSTANRWRYVRNVRELNAWLYIILLAKALLLSLGYACRYFFHKRRIKSSSFAVGSLIAFFVCFALGILSIVVLEDNYQLRNYIGRNTIEVVLVISGFVVLFFVPLMASYLGSFLRERSAGKNLAFATVIPSFCLVAFLLLPTLSSVGNARRVQDGMVFAENMDMQNEQTFAKKTKEMSLVPGQSQGQGKRKVRIRKHFPETLYWNPQLIAEDNKAQITIPVSDSITTFRMVCQGVDRQGNLGATTTGIRVFQDFFVDIDFPVALTQNDVVTVPIQVYNYLKGEQQIKLVVQKEDWFECLGEAQQQLTVSANEVTATHFTIRAKRVGQRQLTVFAYGSKMDDAVRRSVTITPDGKKMETVINGSLSKTIEHKCSIPEDAIAEASKIIVKCYPGVAAVLVEGLEGMLRLPGG